MGDIVRVVRKGRFIGWYVRYRDTDGTRRMRASHQPSRELARRYLVEVEARVARGQVGIPEPAAPTPTISELAARFLTEYSRPRIKDLGQYRIHAGKCLRRVLPLIGDKRADALLTEDVIKLRDTLLGTHSPASVRSGLAYLNTLFTWAMKRQLVASSPLRGVERPSAAVSIDYFSREEVPILLRCAAERAATGQPADLSLSVCLHLALHTGLRKGELLGLRWQDLDLSTQRLTVARSYKTAPKSGKARHLGLPAVCVPLLREWQKKCPITPEGQVFPVERGGNHSTHALLGLPKLLRAAGVRVPAHPWHAMRHTFASHYVMQGGNVLALQKILGHSDVKVTMIYAHLAPDFLRSEMDRLKF